MGIVVVFESAAPVEGWIVGIGPPVRFGGWLELVARVAGLLAAVEHHAGEAAAGERVKLAEHAGELPVP